MNMIQTSRALYKGDKIQGIIYTIIGLVFLFISAILFIHTMSQGWFYIYVGLLLFGVYGFAKGLSIYFVSKKRHQHYMNKENFGIMDYKEEEDYTRFRLEKKASNRRRYMYTFGLGSICLIIALFLNDRTLILGTGIPIVLFSAIEFVIGLAVEFRLWEYMRILERNKPI